jgi:hypothetical protein
MALSTPIHPRIVGRGPITLDIATLADWVKYEVDFEAKIAEAKNATVGYTPGAHANSGWTAKVEYEVPATARMLTTALGCGGYTGLLMQEWSLSFDVTLSEGTGDEDWKRWQVISYKWTVDVSKWAATDSFGTFLALLNTQTATPWASVAFTSDFGGGNVLINKDTLTAGQEVSKEAMSLTGTGALTAAVAGTLDVSLLTAFLSQVDDSVSDGVATPLLLAIGASPFTYGEGEGYVFGKSLKVTAPADDKVTISADFQGDGEWSTTGS